MKINIPKFQKIHALGHRDVANIFDGPVEITEKLDGSQFAFGVVDGELVYRSKGRQIPHYSVQENDLFYPTIQHVEALYEAGRIPEQYFYYGEAFCGPKHSTLRYSVTPRGHLALWGVSTQDGADWFPYDGVTTFAQSMDLDQVARIDLGDDVTAEAIVAYVASAPESQLGGVALEGVVIKNFDQTSYERDLVHTLTCAKYVNEQFKETNATVWKSENTPGGRWNAFKGQFVTEARCNKVIMRMAEDGILRGEPKDIGQFINYIQRDIGEECKQEITEFLWQHFGKELLREATKGAPEWYKEQLALGNINAILENIA